jgi:signal peptidase I
MENTIPKGTYILVWKMDYKPSQNEIIVYRFPEGDTVVMPEYPVSYYEIKRMMNEGSFNAQYSKKFIPFNKRQIRLGRCVGLPHDRIKLIHSRLFVNDKPYFNPDCKKQYIVKVRDTDLLNKDFLKKMNIKPDDIDMGNGATTICLTDDQASRLVINNEIDSVLISNAEKGTQNNEIFPFAKEFGWTKDNFGELTVPVKGQKIYLNKENIALYERLIKTYEQNDLKILDNKIYINGKVSNYYIPKMDYYFIVNDNRDNSVDSRYWGFLPENYIYGKILKIFK